ncbi:late histone H1-like [Dendronephthya gigantea]|uniref:late histone H1-like n=1 Tax=Dendronephthya gigantea TaxID=151771 RepID=UPI00106C2B97|nr:late histone H1-like [Dendronephthya gigantea]
MAPKARKSKKAVRSAGGSKKSVSIEMVKQAVAALGDRNGSTINAIFNYLVRTKKVSAASRTLVILALGRACRDGSMAKKAPGTFVLQAGGKRKAASPKRRKRKAKRARKSRAKSASKKRRRQRKRKNLKKKAKRSTKKRSRKPARKSMKKSRKARRSRKPAQKAFRRPAAKSVRRRPVRRAARRINYRE